MRISMETDAKMSTLSADARQRLADALRQRRALLVTELRQELEASGEQHLVDLAGRVHDAGEESVADLMADLDAARMDRQVGELRDIERALARMTDGTYGDCSDCGQRIGAARLEAQPAAERCVACQEHRERAAGSKAGPKL